jgi:hypothetical protein
VMLEYCLQRSLGFRMQRLVAFDCYAHLCPPYKRMVD